MEALQPNWDLDQYILNYSGHGQIHRLRFIALRSSTLQADALKHAIHLIKDSTLDVSLYQETVEQLRIVDPGSQESILDRSWVENAIRTTKITTEKLEAELKNYKNNLIKESIRVLFPLFFGDAEASNIRRWVIWTLQNTITNQATMKTHSNAIPVSEIIVLRRNTFSINVWTPSMSVSRCETILQSKHIY